MSVLKITFILAIAPLLSGCLTLSFIKDAFGFSSETMNAEYGQYEHSKIDIKDIHIPQPGEKIQITDPQTQQEITVIFGETFQSASGKLCSNVTLEGKTPADSKHGLACLNDNRDWDKSPLDLNLTN